MESNQFLQIMSLMNLPLFYTASLLCYFSTVYLLTPKKSRFLYYSPFFSYLHYFCLICLFVSLFVFYALLHHTLLLSHTNFSLYINTSYISTIFSYITFHTLSSLCFHVFSYYNSAACSHTATLLQLK